MSIDLNALDPALVSYVLRMVVPFKREFGRMLDVHHFFQNDQYAREIIDQAAHTQDARLQNCVNYLQINYFGPRFSGEPTVVTARISDEAQVADQPLTDTERKVQKEYDDARDEAIARYKSRLR